MNIRGNPEAARRNGRKGGRPTKIESIRNTWGNAVAHIAAQAGATGIRSLGAGGEGEQHATFFELLGEGAKFPIRGATTNAEPVWEDDDAEAFAELAEACGVQI